MGGKGVSGWAYSIPNLARTVFVRKVSNLRIFAYLSRRKINISVLFSEKEFNKQECYDEVEKKIINLIAELRNERDTKSNWRKFRNIVNANREIILDKMSLRWLISICDTYADYGGAREKRDAMAISIFVNMLRLAETTRYVCGPFNESRLVATLDSHIPLYDGLMTFSINRQDVFLNMGKRIARQLRGSGILEEIWREILSRYENNTNCLLYEFKAISELPERYFPVNPFQLKDNYGR